MDNFSLRTRGEFDAKRQICGSIRIPSAGGEFQIHFTGCNLMLQIFFGKGLDPIVFPAALAFARILPEKGIREYDRIALLSFHSINDVAQACIKSSQLACPPGIRCKFLTGGKMDTVTKIATETVPSAANNLIASVIAVMCGLGLVVFACAATNGLDMSPGFF
jgi:hypothetical protein